MSSFDATHVDSELPPVDEHLVGPETRYEMHDGVLVHVPPADEPHGTRHSKISALVEAHAAPEFDIASDMLTRTSKTSDVAPDVSLFPRARDLRTGGRQLEHLAFEVVGTGTLKDAGDKARRLAARGVRRLFAIDVTRARALEWSVSLDNWSLLDPSACIEDPVLAAPLPIEALVRAASSDDAVAEALFTKGNPVTKAKTAAAEERGEEKGRARGREEGLAEGLARGEETGRMRGREEGLACAADALIALLAARNVTLQDADRARIRAERDPARISRWISHAASCVDVAELLAES